MSSNGDTPTRDDQATLPSIEDEPDSLEHEDSPAPSLAVEHDSEVAEDSLSGEDNGSEPLPAAAAASSQSPSPGRQASLIPFVAMQNPEPSDNLRKDSAEDLRHEEENDSDHVETFSSSSSNESDSDENHVKNNLDTEVDLLDSDNDIELDEYSKGDLVALFRSQARRRLQDLRNLNQSQTSDLSTQLLRRDEEHARVLGQKKEVINSKSAKIRTLNDQIKRLQRIRPQEIPWLQLLRGFFQEGGENWDHIYRECCRQMNMSLDPKNVHPNLHWADLPAAEVEDDEEEEPQDDAEMTGADQKAQEEAEAAAVGGQETADVNGTSAASLEEAEIGLFPFDRLPFEVQQRVMEHIFVKPGVIHCLSRLDARFEPSISEFPYPCSGTSSLPHRFTYGDNPWSIADSPRPDHELQPLLVCKRWLYLGVHAFYGLNTFAFSSLGEFGRFFKGIGPQRTERVAHVELHWQGSVMAAHKTRVNQRTLPLQYLLCMSRLQTVTIFIEEFKDRRVRRPYEFPKKEKEDKQQNRADDEDEGYRAPGDEYDTSLRLLNYNGQHINGLAPPYSLLKRTSIHANWRGNRSMRTTHGMDYVYALRGLQWFRAYEHDISRKLIRDLTFLDDVNKVVTLPKDPKYLLDSDLHGLRYPHGLATYVPGFEDKAMVSRWYETSTLPSSQNSSDGVSISSQSDDSSSQSDDVPSKDPEEPVRRQSNKSSQGHNAVDRIHKMIFPGEPGYKSKSKDHEAEFINKMVFPDEVEYRIRPNGRTSGMIESIIFPGDIGYRTKSITREAGLNLNDDAEDAPQLQLALENSLLDVQDDLNLDDDSDGDDLLHILRGIRFPDEPGWRAGPGARSSDDGGPDNGGSDTSDSESDGDSDLDHDSDTIMHDGTEILSDSGLAGSTQITSSGNATNEDSVMQVEQLEEQPREQPEKNSENLVDEDDDLFVADDPEVVDSTASEKRVKIEVADVIDLTNDSEHEDEFEDPESDDQSVVTSRTKTTLFAPSVFGMPLLKQESVCERDRGNVIDLTGDDEDDSGNYAEPTSAPPRDAADAATRLFFTPPRNIIYDTDNRDNRRSKSVISHGGRHRTPGSVSFTQSRSPKHNLEDGNEEDEGHNEKRRRIDSPTRLLQQRRARATGFIMSPSP